MSNELRHWMTLCEHQPDFIHGTEKNTTVLIVVHPGSACGSADFNLGSYGAEARAFLIQDLQHWSGGVIVIDGDLSNELAMPRFRPLDQAIKAALSQAAAKGAIAVRRAGNDPAQGRVVRQIIKQLGLLPTMTKFSLTGAWVQSSDDGGCVADVHRVLMRMGFTADVRDSALDLDSR